MQADLANGSEMRRRPVVNRTVFFEELRSSVASYPDGTSAVGWSTPAVEELQVQPHLYRRVLDSARLRFWARTYAELAGKKLDQAAIDTASDALRTRLGLWEPADLDAWLEDHDLDHDDYASMVTDDALASAATQSMPKLPVHDLLYELRIAGLLSPLAERSACKSDANRGAGIDEAGFSRLDDADTLLGDALNWFLEDRLDGRSADNLDLTDLAHELGFATDVHCASAIIREFRFAGPASATP